MLETQVSAMILSLALATILLSAVALATDLLSALAMVIAIGGGGFIFYIMQSTRIFVNMWIEWRYTYQKTIIKQMSHYI